ncbi:hypothetical protein ZWY2020_006198 [Hordeum vulgare]|nr:hypothetical protein ZWY2020_006198 [Hordeum vulgare]
MAREAERSRGPTSRPRPLPARARPPPLLGARARSPPPPLRSRSRLPRSSRPPVHPGSLAPSLPGQGQGQPPPAVVSSGESGPPPFRRCPPSRRGLLRAPVLPRSDAASRGLVGDRVGLPK